MKVLKSAIEGLINRRISRAFSMPKEFGDTKAIDRLAEAVEALANDRCFSDQQRHELLYAINRAILPEFVIADRGRYILKNKKFRAYFERFSAENWKSFERRWNLGEFLKLLSHIPGQLAECGVFRGGNAYQLCQFAQAHGREVHLFDSYEGLSAPNEADGAYWKKGDLSFSEELVHRNLSEFDCFKTYKGWIPDAFPQVENQIYSFVHVDVDLEQPTYDSIAFFYNRLSKGGIILLDDHGYDTCPGARKAALNFMVDKPEPVLDLSSGQGLIIKQ
ncbi:TylF/MycF/NovP-related O-methyltransferase [Pseudaminobacter sp. NGMCC 1.201702]|uniref:TylF/MycF/NovP-related O-methyltransferase n=1 Tax=Pseudaminobacter sp. NGMCC 1.201702 TaxID=3391825 RepID=UPI0039F14140